MQFQTKFRCLFLALSMLVSVQSYAGHLCSELFNSSPNFALSQEKIDSLPDRELKEFLDLPTFRLSSILNHPWREVQLTNPLRHNPDSFMYVIHGVRNGVPNELPVRGATQFISASLITEKYVRSAARFGYILKVSSENVIATWPVDGETTRDNPWQYRETQGVHHPKDLMDRSGWLWQNHRQLLKIGIYNEVLLDSGKGTPELSHKVDIIGLYVVLDKFPKKPDMTIDPQAAGWDGPSLSSAEISAAQELAAKYGLPLVKLNKSDELTIIDRRN